MPASLFALLLSEFDYIFNMSDGDVAPRQISDDGSATPSISLPETSSQQMHATPSPREVEGNETGTRPQHLRPRADAERIAERRRSRNSMLYSETGADKLEFGGKLEGESSPCRVPVIIQAESDFCSPPTIRTQRRGRERLRNRIRTRRRRSGLFFRRGSRWLCRWTVGHLFERGRSCPACPHFLQGRQDARISSISGLRQSDDRRAASRTGVVGSA